MALAIPSMLLKQLHTSGSLKNTEEGVEFAVKNRLSDTTLTGLSGLKFDGYEVPADAITIRLEDGATLTPAELAAAPLDFPLRRTLAIVSAIDPLPVGKHEIEVRFEARPFGKLKLKVDDSITETASKVVQIPRDTADDYGEAAIKARQQFVEEYSGAKLEHTAHYSFDPHMTAGNAENFTGVVQIPLGFAGPITIKGEHAKGCLLYTSPSPRD